MNTLYMHKVNNLYIIHTYAYITRNNIYNIVYNFHERDIFTTLQPSYTQNRNREFKTIDILYYYCYIIYYN